MGFSQSEETEINKRLWRDEKRRFKALNSLLNDVTEMRDVEAVLDSVDDRVRTLWCVNKAEVHRTMYLFMLAKLRRQIYKLNIEVHTLRRELEELRKGNSSI
jgi:hypothetical protein